MQIKTVVPARRTAVRCTCRDRLSERMVELVGKACWYAKRLAEQGRLQLN